MFLVSKLFKQMLVLGCCLLVLPGCASKVSCTGPDCQVSAEDLYVAGMKAMQGKRYSEAKEQLEKLLSTYPLTPYTKRSRLNLIYAYYQKEDYALALAEADRYIRLYPQDENVDYVYYMKGLLHQLNGQVWWTKWFAIDRSQRDLSEARLSLLAFSDLVHFFPNSRYAGLANQQIVSIRHLLAKHELHVGKFYLERKNKTAAYARFTGLIQQYPKTSYAQEARSLIKRQ